MATEEQIKKTMRGMYESFGTIREEMVGDVVTFDEFIQGPSTVVTDEETYTFDRERLEQMARAALEALEPEPTHPDDLAVDAFARDMKAKLAKKRAEGRGGWEDREQCSATFLSRLLREHVEKGDPLDVGNLAMMLHIRGDRIEAVEPEPLEDVLSPYEPMSIYLEPLYSGEIGAKGCIDTWMAKVQTWDYEDQTLATSTGRGDTIDASIRHAVKAAQV